MANFTNTTKNSATATNQTKNVATFTNKDNSHGLFYILTDLLDYVMVGEDEDEFLIWDDFTSYKNIAKN